MECCRLETADRLVRYLAVISVVAWRVFWLTLVSRSHPNDSLTGFLTNDEWAVLFVKFNPGVKIPKKPPTLQLATAWIARLGGYLARKGDGSPGITYMWRGLKKLADMMEGMRIHADIYG